MESSTEDVKVNGSELYLEILVSGLENCYYSNFKQRIIEQHILGFVVNGQIIFYFIFSIYYWGPVQLQITENFPGILIYQEGNFYFSYKKRGKKYKTGVISPHKILPGSFPTVSKGWC